MNTTRRLLLLVGFAGLGSQMRGGAAAPSTTDKIIQLPPMLVEEVIKGKPWLYAEMPGIVVLSRCTQSATIDFIRAQSRAMQLLNLVVPENMRAQTSLPHLVILSPPNLTATAQQQLLKDSRGTPAPVSQAPGGAAGLAAAGRLQLRGGLGVQVGRGPLNIGVNAPIEFLSNLRINDSDEIATYVMLDENAFDADRLRVSDVAVRNLVDRRTPSLPAWLRVGVEEFYRDTQFGTNEITVGPSGWVSSGERRSLATDPYFPRVLFPLKDVFESDGPVDDDRSERAIRWRAEAGLFVRWAIRRDNFWKFVEQALAVGVTEDLLKEYFKLSYADLRDTLSDYLPVAVTNETWRIPGNVQRMTGITTREARPEEIALVKGEWERLEVTYVTTEHPEFIEAYLNQAESELATAYKAGVKDPRFLGTYGLFLTETKRDAEAAPILEAAALAPAARARVLFEVSRLRFEAALANPGGGAGRLSAEQIARALEYIPRARALHPAMPDVYHLVAAAWAKSAVRPTAADLAVLDEGLRYFPGDAGLRALRNAL